MRSKSLRSTLSFILLLTASVSCSKEENAFRGTDGHIITFELTAGGVTYNGAVTEGQVTISVPEGVSLDNASAKVTISENAAISPDPAGITDWNTEEQFIVTSYNNIRRQYLYRLNRTPVTTSGNVVLASQAEVDAFATTGISVVDGNLTIGKVSGAVPADTISDLSGLRNLKQVAHNITINTTYGGENLSGLENLEKAGGLKIGAVKSLTDISLPGLHTIGTQLSISSVTAMNIHMPALAFVGEDLIVKSDSMRKADFGELKTVGGSMLFNGTNGTSTKNPMTSVSFPTLESVGGTLDIRYWPAADKLGLPALKTVSGHITITHWAKADELRLPALERAGGLTIDNANLLAEIEMPLLAYLNGAFSIASVPGLTWFEFPALREVSGNITLNAGAATNVSFPILESIGGTLYIPSGASKLAYPSFPGLRTIKVDLDIRSTKITDLSAFPSLEEIGARLYLYNATGLTSLSGAGSLRRIASSLYLYGMTNLAEVDLRGIEVGSIDIYTGTYNKLKLIGDEVFGGRIYFGTNTTSSMPEMTGFKTSGTLEVSTGSYSGDIIFENVENITGLLNFTSSNNSKAITMNKLRTAGGIKFSYNNSLVSVNMPALEEITGYTDEKGSKLGGFTYPVSSKLNDINLPLLSSVEGDFAVTNIRTESTIQKINAPALTSITGILNLTGQSNSASFNDLSNFVNLRSAGGVTISTFKNLASFDGLKNVISSFAAGQWKVSGCGYNPTYQNMVDGQYGQ